MQFILLAYFHKNSMTPNSVKSNCLLSIVILNYTCLMIYLKRNIEILFQVTKGRNLMEINISPLFYPQIPDISESLTENDKIIKMKLFSLW